jgi:hypothetical protein
MLHSILETTTGQRLHDHHTVRLEVHRALVELLTPPADGARMEDVDECMRQAHVALRCMRAHLPKWHPSVAHMHERGADATLAKGRRLGAAHPAAGELFRAASRGFRRATVVLERAWGFRHPHCAALRDKAHAADQASDQAARAP